jgi:hypothetical protein
MTTTTQVYTVCDADKTHIFETHEAAQMWVDKYGKDGCHYVIVPTEPLTLTEVQHD